MRRLSAVSTNTGLDSLVDEWLTVPDVAERLGQDAGKVRRMLQERRLVGVRRGSPPVVSVPARFLVPAHLENPANAQPVVEGSDRPAWVVLGSLQGTLNVLADVGLVDEDAIVWLFTPEDSLPGAPIDALLDGRKTEVRRRAQAEL